MTIFGRAFAVLLLAKFVLLLVWRGRLSGKLDRGLGSLAIALYDLLIFRTSSDERAWIRKIRALRRDLAVSTALHGQRDLTVGQVYKTASISHVWALLLFRLIRAFRSSVGLELGTCLGVSAAYQGAALKMNGEGSLFTLEGDTFRVKLARAHMQRLGLDNVHVVAGRFEDTLPGTLEMIVCEQGRIDYAFIDGNHNEEATIAYFESLIPHLAERAIVVFDDISWTDGMKRAWRRIERDPRVQVTVDLLRLGVCIIDSGCQKKIMSYRH